MDETKETKSSMRRKRRSQQLPILKKYTLFRSKEIMDTNSLLDESERAILKERNIFKILFYLCCCGLLVPVTRAESLSSQTPVSSAPIASEMVETRAEEIARQQNISQEPMPSVQGATLSQTNQIITPAIAQQEQVQQVNSQNNEETSQNQSIVMLVGTIKVIDLPNIARVAVGDSKVIQANTDDDKTLILFARSEGTTTLAVWDKSGMRHSFAIDVQSAQEQELKEDILQIVKRIPNVKASIVGDKVIVEGDRLSDADRERIQKLSSYYPQIVDMSSQIGWDEMVMLDVQIVELPRHYIQELGVKWGSTTQGGFQIGGAVDVNSASLLKRPGEMFMDAALGSRVGYAGLNALLSSSIQAMADNGQAVILAQPQLMARSGATAEFLAGGEVPYSVVDANGNTQTIFKPYGVSLYITPRIEKNGIIRSKINVEVSAVDSSMNLAGGPALKTRRTSTEFNVKSGEPLVLSGFISRDQMQGMSRLPGASEIPILGELFRSRRFQSNETELVIIVRPMVVSSHNKSMKQRVNRTKAVLDSSFDDKPILNVDIEPDLSPPPEEKPQLRESPDYGEPLQAPLPSHLNNLSHEPSTREPFAEEHLQFRVEKRSPKLRKINKKATARNLLPLSGEQR